MLNKSTIRAVVCGAAVLLAAPALAQQPVRTNMGPTLGEQWVSPLHNTFQGAPTARTVSGLLTPAHLLTRIITVNQGAAGASAQQLPTAAALDAALPYAVVNTSIEFSVINLSTTSAESASLTTNTGWTLVGAMDIPAYSAAGSLNSSARFLARRTAAGAWTLYRIS